MNRTTLRAFARLAAAFALCAACGPLASRPASAAQIFENVVLTSAPVLDLDPSARSMAMGGASTAVCWGDDANHWANPALLGFARGLRYEQSDVKPVPDALPDARFKTRRTTLGYGGLGVAIAGQPFDGLGETTLDFGTLPPGTFTGTTQPLYPREKVRSWGIGVSAAGVAQSLAALGGHAAPAFARYVDVGLGVNRKHVEDPTLDPQNPEQATCWDWGVIARVVAPIASSAAMAPRRIELAYAYSVLNSNDTQLYANPTARQFRNGLAVRATFEGPRGWSGVMPGWIRPGLEPFLSVGVAYDADHLTAGSRDRSGFDVDGYGAEVALANVVFARVGHSRNDVISTRTGDTWGIGAGLPLGRWGGVRYDHAQVSRAASLGDVRPDSWSLWLDPVAVLRDAR